MLSSTYADILTDHKSGFWFNSKKYEYLVLEHLYQLGLLEIQVDNARRVIWFRLAGVKKFYDKQRNLRRKAA